MNILFLHFPIDNNQIELQHNNNKTNGNINKQSNITEFNDNIDNNVNDNDNDNDNVNVNVNVNENEINKKTNTRFNFRKSLIDLGADKELASEWIKVRKTKKATNSKTAFNNFEKETKKSKYSIDEILKACVVKSWSGFKNSWDLGDSIDEEAIQNPYNEELIKYNSNVNPTVFKLPKSQFLKMQQSNKSGGYIYKILA